jgi:mono/diheme cytochrome c family protein
MMSKRFAGPIVATTLYSVIALAGCGLARKEPGIDPMKITDASVQRGKAVFDAHCYSCHLRGQGGMAPALNNKPLPKSVIKFQVRRGLGAMPAFSEEQISDSQLEDLANFVAALRQHSQ